MADWCKKNNVVLLANTLEFKAGRLTGRMVGENCHGAEKARRIRAHFDLAAFERIYAYGDSRGDRAMLSLADEPYWRRF